MNRTKVIYKTLLLFKLRGPLFNLGLCKNLLDNLDKLVPEGTCGITSSELKKWLFEQFELWPKFSGDIHYPIPCPEDCDSAYPDTLYEVARIEGFMWDSSHSYGALRWELLDFLIAQAEKGDRN